MGRLISFPSLPTKKQLAWFPPSVVDACNFFFPLAGNLVNWKITDFRFSGSSSWPQRNHPCKQTWQEKHCVACFMDHDKHVNEGRNKNLGSHQTMLSSGESHFLKSPNMKRLRGKALSGEIQFPTYDGSTYDFLTLGGCQSHRHSGRNHAWNLEHVHFPGLVTAPWYSREAALAILGCSGNRSLATSQPEDQVGAETSTNLSTVLYPDSLSVSRRQDSIQSITRELNAVL